MDQIPQFETKNTKTTTRNIGSFLQDIGKDFEQDSIYPGIKTKNWQLGPHKTKMFTYSYGNNQLSEEQTHRIEENLCQLLIWQRIIENIKRTQKTKLRKQMTQFKKLG